MTTALIKEALADESVTERAAERARIATTTANAKSTVTIREMSEADRVHREKTVGIFVKK